MAKMNEKKCNKPDCKDTEKELAIQKIIVDMLDSWYIRSTSEEAQRKSPLMTLIEQTPQDAFISMMNDESQPMNPIMSMMSDEAQQQTAILSMMNDDEPLQQNPIMPALNEPPAADLSSSVEDESDEDESVTYVTDYRQLYSDLKQNLKCVIKENVYFKEVLKTSQKRLLQVLRDRSFLLDRLQKYQSAEGSSSDSDATVVSDDSVKVEAQPKKRKLETITSQGTAASTMKPPATPRRNKKNPKKQQQQQQKRQQQQQQKQQQKKQQQQQQQQVPQPAEQITGPVLPMAAHLTVPQQQLPPQQQLLQQPEQSSHDMLDQLTPEEQLLLHMQQDKLMDLIKQIPQSQQMLQAAQPQSQQQQQLIQPHRPTGPQTQQQLMQSLQLQPQQQQQLLQSQQAPQVVQPQVLVDPQQMLQPVRQIQLLQSQPLQAMAPSQQQSHVQQYINTPTPPVMLQMRQPQINQRQISQQQQQQQIRQHQIDQMELQQLQQHILFQPPTFVQQPATSNAYQFPLSMMSQVPTELLATTSYTDIDVPGDDISMEGQITKEELERHLQSRQTMPQVIPEGELPIEMFNNNSSTEPNDQLN